MGVGDVWFDKAGGSPGGRWGCRRRGRGGRGWVLLVGFFFLVFLVGGGESGYLEFVGSGGGFVGGGNARGGRCVSLTGGGFCFRLGGVRGRIVEWDGLRVNGLGGARGPGAGHRRI